MASKGSPPGRTCESCGRDGDTVEPVRRVYLGADEAGGLRPDRTMPEIEWWCPACRVQYPNEPTGG